jgi:hypothetical protein
MNWEFPLGLHPLSLFGRLKIFLVVRVLLHLESDQLVRKAFIFQRRDVFRFVVSRGGRLEIGDAFDTFSL